MSGSRTLAAESNAIRNSRQPVLGAVVEKRSDLACENRDEFRSLGGRVKDHGEEVRSDEKLTTWHQESDREEVGAQGVM